ncbi:MAG: CoA ester lyase [Burkholderiaceae bacterium]|jgi:citrate lyase subunit beta / citryl-CoA lyase|nr:CoA ester lyase [Burkholderiaceae bacterium]
MHMLRSLLFVPGDSEKKLAKSISTSADALILDLEDSVSPDRTAIARSMVAEFLKAHSNRKQQLWVRINPLQTPLALHDLVAVMAGKPDGIMLPKPLNAKDAQQLDHCLSALEVREGLALGSTRIIPVATEVAGALFDLQSYAGATPRLQGLTWGAEDLATAVGATSNRDASGEFTFTYKLARSLCLLASAHAEVQAIDTLSVDFKDMKALAADVQNARREGFSGKLAIHPDQVEVINQGFTPSAHDLSHAQRIVDAFAQAQGAGAVQLDGKMVDKPHLTQALRLLQLSRKH